MRRLSAGNAHTFHTLPVLPSRDCCRSPVAGSQIRITASAPAEASRVRPSSSGNAHTDQTPPAESSRECCN